MQKFSLYAVDFSFAFCPLALFSSSLFLYPYSGNHNSYQPIPASHRLMVASRSAFAVFPPFVMFE